MVNVNGDGMLIPIKETGHTLDHNNQPSSRNSVKHGGP